MKDCCYNCENLEYQENYVYPYRCLRYEALRFSEKEIHWLARKCWEIGGCDYHKKMEER